MEALVVKRNSPEMIAMWTERITECKNSGLSAQEWCSENEINVKTYYYWHSKIRKMIENQQASFFEIPQSGNFSSGTPEATIKINGIDVDIYSGAGTETIRAICMALKSC